MQIPKYGRPSHEILSTLDSFKSSDLDWKSGKVWGYVYDPGETSEVTQAAYLKFLSENGLDPTVFPSLLKLETDVVRSTIQLLRGDGDAVGNLTSGGTESIILAVKTARDRARALQPQIVHPEMVLPRTAHAAFHKAAHYLGIKPVMVEIDPQTFRVHPDDVRKAISDSTILLVASAPNYSQGVIDPIEEIAAIASQRGLLFHVDACVGGVHLSIMRDLGYDLPAFDFTLPGVTSISTDLHKYGYAAKGCSVIMYRNKELRKHQIFACTDTTGYSLINTTILSSKSGGPMAGAWATLNSLGMEGYRRIVTQVQQATGRLIEGINAIAGLHVLGQPIMSMFSFASDSINVYQLADEMTRRGWFLQPQFSTECTPRNLHMSVGFGTSHQVENLLADLRESVESVRQGPPIDSQAIRTMVQSALTSPDPQRAFAQLAQQAGLSGTSLPTDLAFINEVLDALPSQVCNEFLINFFNELYV